MEKKRSEIKVRAEQNEVMFDEETTHTTKYTSLATARNNSLAKKIAERWNKHIEDKNETD